MTQNRYYSNTAVITTLTNSTGMNAVETDLIVNSTTGWPSSFPFIVRLEPDTPNEELVLATSGLGTSGTPYTVTRGYDGTSAKSHASGTAAEHGFSQLDFSEPQQHLNLSGTGSASHGLPDSAWQGGTQQMIQSITLGASGVFTFSSIPATFSHLKLYVVCVSNDTSGTSFCDIALQFNNDFSGHYSYGFVYMLNSTTVASAVQSAQTSVHAGFATNGGLNPTSNAGVGTSVIDIPLYATVMTKQITWNSHASTGVGAPNNHQVGSGGGVWGNNTSAISTIKISPVNTPNTFAPGSQAFLYGIL